MYKISYKPSPKVAKTLDEEGRILYVNVDNTFAQPFNTNNHGWTKNDIKAYNDANSEQERQMILQRLNVLKETYNANNAELSDEQIASMIPPKSFSSPNEYIDFQQNVAEWQEAQNALKREVVQQKVEPAASEVKTENS